MSWATVEQWAVAMLDEWRAEKYGEAHEFTDAACHDAVHGVVDALIVLAETANGDADLLSLVGAGPLEDLVSHTGNGVRVLPDVDRSRLGELGARVLSQP